VHVHNGEVGRRQKRAEKRLRKRAETMPEHAVQQLRTSIEKVEVDSRTASPHAAHVDDATTITTTSRDELRESEDAYLIDEMMTDEDDLEVEVQNVLADVDVVEQDEVETNNSLLTTAVKTMEDSIASYLSRAFGYGGDDDDDDVDDDDDDAAAVTDASSDVKLTEDQLDDIAKKISERLELDAKAEFKSKAEIVKAEKKDAIKKVVEEDRHMNMDTRDVSEPCCAFGSVFFFRRAKPSGFHRPPSPPLK
jgi:hypothetical protein